MKIIKNQNIYDINESSLNGTTYVEDLNVRVIQTLGGLRITELEGALRTGKTCTEYSISYNSNGGCMPLIELTWNRNLKSLKDIYEWLKSLEFSNSNWGGYSNKIYAIQKDTSRGIERDYEVHVGKSEEKGVRVFSPFNLSHVKPLKEVPAKWKLTHVIKALINGQYEDLKKNYYMTDDYAFDAAYNFQKGKISEGLEFIKKIIESPRGWWTSLETGGRVSVCCHSFDSNEFVLKIN